jgi:hypothetical protein
MHAKHDEPRPTTATLFVGCLPHLPFHFPFASHSEQGVSNFCTTISLRIIGSPSRYPSVFITDHLPLPIANGRDRSIALAGLPLPISDICQNKMSHIGVWSNNNNLAKTHHCSNLGATYFHILHRPNLASGRGTGLNPFVTLLLQVAFQTTLHVAACSGL